MTSEKLSLRTELESRSTEELRSILRNRDDDEWRPEVFDIVASILASRGLSPAEIIELGPEGEDVVETRELVTLGRYLTPIEAQTDRMALEAAGLPAWISDEASGALYGPGIGTRLQVRTEDEEAARAVLEEQPALDAAAQSETPVDACPICSSNDVAAVAGDSIGTGMRLQCRGCGHTWNDE